MDDFCWGLEKQSSTLGEMRIASMATTSTFSISPLFGFGDGNVYVWSIRSGKEVVVLDFSKVNIIQLMHNKFMNQLQAKTLLKGYLRELRQLYKRTKMNRSDYRGGDNHTDSDTSVPQTIETSLNSDSSPDSSIGCTAEDRLRRFKQILPRSALYLLHEEQFLQQVSQSTMRVKQSNRLPQEHDP
ncbi:uncharacterized protein LOC133824558 isoform X2 [Humulus lupulus]|uniref:uncharacterized protein LOC133824558 isoform X2 n=1 Tax=Humulus lupulus TaxID=3486 RepID=UPI002B4015D2|nr:uncharacterized protein LOC133824558 isoform X2 [Humulus lupulus]